MQLYKEYNRCIRVIMNGMNDNNYTFMKKHYDAVLVDVGRNAREIHEKLRNLSEDDCQQWIEMRELKCRNLWSKCQEASDEGRRLLKEIALLLSVAQRCGRKYNTSIVESILKELYYDCAREKFSHEDIVREFKNFGFDVSNYQVLVYEEPWYAAIFRCFRD